MQERDYQSLLVQQDEHIVTLTFNKPEKKNPLSQDLVNELLWALDDAEGDDNVRVIVLTGAGSAFSAGADLKGMSADRGKLEKKGLLPLRRRLRKRGLGDAGDQAGAVSDDDHGGPSTRHSPS